MLIKISYQDCLNNHPLFPRVDNANEQLFYPKVRASYILRLHSRSAKGHARTLSLELPRLIGHMNIGSLIFLGDSKRAWRYQESNYPPVHEAHLYLERNKVGKRFDGALEVTLEELPAFVKHLYWLVRCNAALPVFHFMNDQQDFVGSICQYGNVHISTLSTSADNLFPVALEKSNFINADSAHCYDTFSNKSQISNRKTIA